LREQNALPYGALGTGILTAKAAIDNCRAGRAAKGENLVFCAKKSYLLDTTFFMNITKRLAFCNLSCYNKNS